MQMTSGSSTGRDVDLTPDSDDILADATKDVRYELGGCLETVGDGRERLVWRAVLIVDANLGADGCIVQVVQLVRSCKARHVGRLSEEGCFHVRLNTFYIRERACVMITA